MLYGSSSNGVDSIFTGSLSVDFGSSAVVNDGINWATGASGGVAIVAITTGSGAGAGTYLVTLGAQGSGITLTTANVISQVFLSGFTGTLSGGNFE